MSAHRLMSKRGSCAIRRVSDTALQIEVEPAQVWAEYGGFRQRHFQRLQIEEVDGLLILRVDDSMRSPLAIREELAEQAEEANRG